MAISLIYNKLLFYNTIFLIILNILIHFNLLCPSIKFQNKTEYDKSKFIQLNKSFNETISDAYDAYQYLYLLGINKAPIKSVIESESIVNEKFCCSIYYYQPKLILHNNKFKKKFEFIDWFKSVTNNINETFYLFSSYWDNRKNSLYPKTSASVQVNLF